MIPTGEIGYNPMTRTLAIPKTDPDIIITEQNYGKYLIGVVFKEIVWKRLMTILTT